jgi:hypothetical protein
MKMVREYTNKIIEMVDEGLLDRDELIRDLLNWMSESDVKDFYVFNGWADDGDENPDEDDGQPSEMDEWRDYDADC